MEHKKNLGDKFRMMKHKLYGKHFPLNNFLIKEKDIQVPQLFKGMKNLLLQI